MSKGSWDDLKEHVSNRYNSIVNMPAISILQCGDITFNVYLVSQIKPASYVSLAYSPSNKAIVFNFSEDPKLGFSKISKRDKVWRIHVSNFLKENNLSASKSIEVKLEELPKIGKRWVAYL